tara:strand:+ start:9268 stop:9531 length:264 start_codon:yes stop_codon:yes gene_type:complete
MNKIKLYRHPLSGHSMIKFNDIYVDTAYDRGMTPGEFELQTPFWALSQLDGRHALELHYRAIEGRGREEVTDALAAYVDFHQGKWVY